MKRIPRKSSKHKGLLKRVQRQILKEQRSGLFENEEVRYWICYHKKFIINMVGLNMVLEIPTKSHTMFVKNPFLCNHCI